MSSRRGWRRHRDELGELPEVLGGGSEVELITCSIRARSRSRSSFRMRLRCANSISTFLRSLRDARPSFEFAMSRAICRAPS